MRAQAWIPFLAALAGRTTAQSLADLLAGADNLSSLLEAVSGFPDLLAALAAQTEITIFAPDNNAFAALPSGLDSDTIRAVLTYHVVQGVFTAANFTDDNQALTTFLVDNPAFVNVTNGQVLNAKLDEGSVLINDDFIVSLAGTPTPAEAVVTQADITFDGGVVHIIDSVLLPPTDIVTTLGTSQTANIDLSTLVQALSDTGVVDALATASDLTVFAPNNSAFEGVNLADFTTEQIVSILQYHVIMSENVAYGSVLQSGNFTTLQGGDVIVEVINEDNIRVNNARVILADVLTANGVVHVIDGLLTPGEAVDETPAPTPDDGDDDDDDDDDDDTETVNSASALSFSAWALVASLSMAMVL